MNTRTLHLRLPLLLSFAALSSAAIAQAPPPLPPRAGVTHKSVADTLPPPASSVMTWPGLPAGLSTWYRNLGLPVLSQTTPNERLFAFAGRVNLVGPFITAANDEGVFSNGPAYSLTGLPGSFSQLVFSEAAPVGANNLGNLSSQLATGSTLTNPSVERLQISSNGIVTCQTASNDGTNNFKQGLSANSSLADLGAAGAVLPMTDRAAPVMDDQCRNVGAREQWLGPIPQRVDRFSLPGGIGVPMNPLLPVSSWFVASTTPTPLGGLWQLGQGAVSRPANPSISGDGAIAAYCMDDVGPSYTRPQIRVSDAGGTQFVIMRQGTPCGPNPITGATHFGVVNASLMALNNRNATGNQVQVIAWQMTNMRSAPNSGIINTPSLWCRQTPIAPSYVAHVGMAAPGIPGYTISGFYALHVTDEPASTFSSRIIFGANLSPAGVPAKRAIYTCKVAGGVASPPSLIATNVPGITPVLPYTPGLHNIDFFGTGGGGSGHLFSASRNGEILFKAQLGTTVPAANRQVLVTASPFSGYALQVWAQSGVTTTSSMGGTPMTFTNFSLTQPEQGTYSRGQAISTLPGTLGTAFNTTLAYRGHAGANQAIILAY